MQRVFLLSFLCGYCIFDADRPCLLFQIEAVLRASVGRIEADDYAKLVAQAKSFLGGKANSVQKELAAEMEQRGVSCWSSSGPPRCVTGCAG